MKNISPKAHLILQLLNEGKSQREVAKALKMAKQTIHQHTQRLLKLGLIQELKTTPFFEFREKLYSATNEGKSQIGPQSTTSSPGGDAEPTENVSLQKDTRPRWLMHHAQFKYPILKDAPIRMNIEVPMKNWVKKIDEWKYCNVVKSDSTIIFHIKNLIGYNPSKLLLNAKEIANRMASIYEDNWGLELGRPTQLGTEHYKDLWDNEVWAEYKKYVTLETEGGFIDNTPPGGGPEFKSVESAANYINMGDNVAKLIGVIEKVEMISNDVAYLKRHIKKEDIYIPLDTDNNKGYG